MVTWSPMAESLMSGSIDTDRTASGSSPTAAEATTTGAGPSAVMSSSSGRTKSASGMDAVEPVTTT